MKRLSDTHTVLYEKNLPKEAQNIRSTVFEKEQGFVDEIDGTDENATHFVVFDGEKPVATCRVFLNSAEKGTDDVYLLGRFAVLHEYRSRHIGAYLLQEVDFMLPVSMKSKAIHGSPKLMKNKAVRMSGLKKSLLDYL